MSEDRQFLADIRNDKLEADIKIEEYKLNKLDERMTKIEEQLEKDNLTDAQREAFKAQLQSLKEQSKEIKKELKTDTIESKLWEKVMDKNPPC